MQDYIDRAHSQTPITAEAELREILARGLRRERLHHAIDISVRPVNADAAAGAGTMASAATTPRCGDASRLELRLEARLEARLLRPDAAASLLVAQLHEFRGGIKRPPSAVPSAPLARRSICRRIGSVAIFACSASL